MNSYLRLIRCFVSNSIIRELEFTVNFFLQFLGYLLWFVFTIIFFNIIYSHTQSINGWTIHQTHLLIATNQIIIYLYQAFFAKNMRGFPGLVEKGMLDYFLTKPIDIQFVLSLRYFDIKAILLLPIPVLLLGYSIISMNLKVSLIQIILFVLFTLLAVILRYLLSFCIMMPAFFLVRISALHAIQNEFLQYAAYPAGIFHGRTRFLFSFMVPVLLVANLPVSFILKTLENQNFLAGFAILYIPVLFLVSRKCFGFCLRSYTSASS